MTRWTVLALVLVVVALAAVVVGVIHTVKRDRAALVDRFAADHLSQVEQAARDIEEDLNDIGDDLRFAVQLLQTTDSPVDRRRELGALIAVVKQYKLAATFDETATATLVVGDPTARSEIDPTPYKATMRETARRALDRQVGEIETSPPIDAGAGWYRVFAAPLPGLDGRPAGALALLVDTEPIFGKLRLIASEPSTRLLLIGAHGRSTPVSDPELGRAVAEGRLEPLLGAMRSGQGGTMRLGEAQAASIGLGRAEAIAAFMPIPMRGGGRWAVATLTSTVALRAHERALVLRLALASGAAGVLLIAFGAYVLVASRRAVAVRERLRHADRLAHLHEKTEKILDNIPTGVMALSEDGRITALNRALRERIPAAAVGGPLTGAFPQAPAAVVARLRALIDGARVSDRVKSLLGERLALFGEEGQYNLHVVPLEPRFPEARVLLVVEDLSDVRQLESQLLRTEKLATVGMLAAGIAHEIGTPLGVVRGRAEYVLGKLGGEHPQASGIRIIVDQIDHVTRTIRQLLDFSRVRPAAVRSVAIEPIARAVHELMRYELERRKLSFELDVPADLPSLMADPDQLQQVLVNLVMNACDACSPGGRIALAARPDDDTATAWRRVRLDVVDDGCGIPEESRHQVFDPFFTTKKRGQGTGLGLTMTAQIVRNHGGQIELDSETGRGTRVTLLWPAAQPQERHGAAAQG